MTGMTENNFINTKAVSYRINADLEIPEGGAEGVIICQAGQTGGWCLYVKDGRPKYAYNWLAREMYTIEGDEPLPTGKVTVGFEFDYDGGGLNKGATGRLYVNGDQVAEGRIERDHGRHLLPRRRDRRRRRRCLVTGHRRLRPLGQRLHRHDQQDHHHPHRHTLTPLTRGPARSSATDGPLDPRERGGATTGNTNDTRRTNAIWHLVVS